MPDPNRDCGNCSLCCKLFSLNTPGFEKPTDTWCRYCKPGATYPCTVYDKRPDQCADYQCLWLQSKDADRPLPEELKPNRCKVIFDMTADQKMMVARVDPAFRGAERDPAVRAFIQGLERNGIPTYVVCGDSRRFIGRSEQLARQLERAEQRKLNGRK